jgi:Putative peptidoglycan binding domain
MAARTGPDADILPTPTTQGPKVTPPPKPVVKPPPAPPKPPYPAPSPTSVPPIGKVPAATPAATPSTVVPKPSPTPQGTGDLSGLGLGTSANLGDLFPGADAQQISDLLASGGYGEALRYKLGLIEADLLKLKNEADAANQRAQVALDQGKLALAQKEEADAQAIKVQQNILTEQQQRFTAQGNYADALMKLGEAPENAYRYAFARYGLAPPQGSSHIMALPEPDAVKPLLLNPHATNQPGSVSTVPLPQGAVGPGITTPPRPTSLPAANGPGTPPPGRGVGQVLQDMLPPAAAPYPTSLPAANGPGANLPEGRLSSGLVQPAPQPAPQGFAQGRLSSLAPEQPAPSAQGFAQGGVAGAGINPMAEGLMKHALDMAKQGGALLKHHLAPPPAAGQPGAGGGLASMMPQAPPPYGSGAPGLPKYAAGGVAGTQVAPGTWTTPAPPRPTADQLAWMGGGVPGPAPTAPPPTTGPFGRGIGQVLQDPYPTPTLQPPVPGTLPPAPEVAPGTWLPPPPPAPTADQLAWMGGGVPGPAPTAPPPGPTPPVSPAVTPTPTPTPTPPPPIPGALPPPTPIDDQRIWMGGGVPGPAPGPTPPPTPTPTPTPTPIPVTGPPPPTLAGPPRPTSPYGMPNESQNLGNYSGPMLTLPPYLQSLFAQTGHQQSGVPISPPQDWMMPRLGTPSAQSLRFGSPDELANVQGFERDIEGKPIDTFKSDISQHAEQGGGLEVPHSFAAGGIAGLPSGSPQPGPYAAAGLPPYLQGLRPGFALGGVAGIPTGTGQGVPLPPPQPPLGTAQVPGMGQVSAGPGIFGEAGPEAAVPLNSPGGPLAMQALAANQASQPNFGALFGPTSTDVGPQLSQAILPLTNIPTQHLGPGLRSEAVGRLQQALEQAGYLQMPPSANYGFYGPVTVHAVRTFQQDQGITSAQPGIWDKKSAQALKLYLQGPASTPPGPSPYDMRGAGAPGDLNGPQLGPAAGGPPSPSGPGGLGGMMPSLGL